MAMNIYLVTQTQRNGYDTYDSFICYAETEEQARHMKPDGSNWDKDYYEWCSKPQLANVKYLGVDADTDKQEVILASFNAG